VVWSELLGMVIDVIVPREKPLSRICEQTRPLSYS
jgi:hypothetical protein